MALIKHSKCEKKLSKNANICSVCVHNTKSLNCKSDEHFFLCINGMILGVVSVFYDYYCLVSILALVISITGVSLSTNKKYKNSAIFGIVFSSIKIMIFIICFAKLLKLIA